MRRSSRWIADAKDQQQHCLRIAGRHYARKVRQYQTNRWRARAEGAPAGRSAHLAVSVSPPIIRRDPMHSLTGARLIGIPVLSDLSVLYAEHVEPESLVMIAIAAGPCLAHVSDHHIVFADDV
jgi:hypothetical protein